MPLDNACNFFSMQTMDICVQNITQKLTHVFSDALQCSKNGRKQRNNVHKEYFHDYLKMAKAISLGVSKFLLHSSNLFGPPLIFSLLGKQNDITLFPEYQLTIRIYVFSDARVPSSPKVRQSSDTQCQIVDRGGYSAFPTALTMKIRKLISSQE